MDGKRDAPISIAAGRALRRFETGSVDPATDTSLSFAGSPSVTLPAGADVYSDPVAFDARALSDLAIKLMLDIKVPEY